MRILFTLVFLCTSASVIAKERITNFHSDIIIYNNSEMRVTENIDVNAGGNKIKRGIYRDFPTKYKDRLDNNYQVGFDIQAVLRNGNSEDYHVKSLPNGVRIYFGQEDRYLDHGNHQYVLRYKTNRQLGFFEDHDELYWNVTGNDWDFTIDKASADIELPVGIPANKIILEAYTGLQGAKEQKFEAYIDVGNRIHFETTSPLYPKQGLSIVVSFPKGFVNEPSTEDKLHYLFEDNKHLLYAAIGLLLLCGYYWFSWIKVGKDPEKGVIIAHYRPPDGYSPASMRFIEKMGYDNNCFASAIINLAVKGFLMIKENSNNDYTLKKTGQDVDMAAGETALTKSLFNNNKSIILKQSNHKRIASAINAHKASLKNDYELKYFLTNTAYFVIGILISIIILTIILFSSINTFNDPEALFFLIWLTPWTLACIAMSKSAWNHFTSKNYFSAIKSLFFIAPFLFFEIVVAILFVYMTSISLIIILLILCAINWLFFELLKKPTYKGRKLLDKIEGFREYINLAEKHELDYKHPKGKCPELFEQYLPYALALNVEDSWARQFASVLQHAKPGDQTYSPGWYHGGRWESTNLSGFTSSLNSSFSSAIASSSTAPGSSSGSSGGGFSGGGGGGGGGGGW